jgi:hypothetical protein
LLGSIQRTNDAKKNRSESETARCGEVEEGLMNVQAEVVLGGEHVLKGACLKKGGKFVQDDRVEEAAQEQGFDCSTGQR